MYNGELLRKVRLLKGLDQTGVAKKIGKSQQAISKKERKEEIDEKEFMRIMKVIGCSDKELDFIRNYPPRKIAD